MGRNLIHMLGDEFVKKLLAGERDFQNIRLEPGFNLSGHEAYLDLNNRLKFGCDCENPINVSGSSFYLLSAELDWSHVIGKNASFYGAVLGNSSSHSAFNGAKLQSCDFRHATLENVQFHGANLRGAKFGYANLQQASFIRANLNCADFESANLSDTKLYRAQMRHTNLKDANLRGASLDKADMDNTIFNNTNLTMVYMVNVKNLDKVQNLIWGIYDHTRVTAEEKKVIEQAALRAYDNTKTGKGIVERRFGSSSFAFAVQIE